MSFSFYGILWKCPIGCIGQVDIKLVHLLHHLNNSMGADNWKISCMTSPWSLSVRSSHPTFQSHGQIGGLDFNQYVCFSFRVNQNIFSLDIANSIFELQGQDQGQTLWSIWCLNFNWYVCFLVHAKRSIFGLNMRFHIWPWKFKVKLMTKVQHDDLIWGIAFNRCLLFVWRHWNHFGWDIANSRFALEVKFPQIKIEILRNKLSNKSFWQKSSKI